MHGPTAEEQPAIARDIIPSEYATDVRDTPVRNAVYVQVLNKDYPENGR